VTRLFVAGDNDPEGRRAMAQAMECHARPDLDLVEALPPAPFKDWARVLEAEAQAGRR
jgi:hypothetical protein